MEGRSEESVAMNLDSPLYQVQRYDDFFPPDVWSRLLSYFREEAAFRYGWPSDKSVSEFTHWHLDFLNKAAPKQGDAETSLFSVPAFRAVADAWRYLQGSVLKGHRLVRCYANAHTYGVEGYVHTDALVDSNYTALVYLVSNWQSEWAGETVFLNDIGEIVDAAIPRPNRLLVFDGQQLHAARSLSRACPELRVTLMFKTVAPKVQFTPS
jgi:hypothetical protein